MIFMQMPLIKKFHVPIYFDVLSCWHLRGFCQALAIIWMFYSITNNLKVSLLSFTGDLQPTGAVMKMMCVRNTQKRSLMLGNW